MKKTTGTFILKNISVIISAGVLLVTFTAHLVRESARMDYLSEQIIEIRENQNNFDAKVDKIYQIVSARYDR